MKLSTRLLLLLGVCLLPVITAQIYMRHDLARLHRSQLGVLALGQAEIANGDLGATLAGARHLAQVIGQTQGLETASGCEPALARLAPLLVPYRFVAVLDAKGRAVCATGPAAPALTPAPIWAQVALDVPGFHVGLGQGAAAKGGFLPLSLALPHADGRPGGAVLLGLDLGWLDAHLASFDLSATNQAGDGVLLVTDRAGTILARTKTSGDWLTPALLPMLRHLAAAAGPGIAELRGADGQTRLAAYLPATHGVMVAMVYRSAPLAAMIDHTATRQTLLILTAVLLALAMVLVAARYYVVRPAADLLAVARHWQAGNFAARAARPGPALEFRQMTETFNGMAAALEHRQRQQAAETQSLAARVEERGQALSSTADRLQIEIAERKNAETALLQAQKFQTFGQLAGGLAHDFNNMLATIMGSLELLERRIPRMEKAEQAPVAALVERAIASVQRAAQLTSRMLAFARRPKRGPQPIDVNQLIVDLLGLARSTLGRKVIVETALAEDLWRIAGDPGQLETALLQLCLNARDAMPEGGTLTLRTENLLLREETGAAAPGAYVRISVTDTGPGMAEAVRSRAFEPFFTTKGGKGMGMGLSQVHGMAAQMAGAVAIDTRVGEGTTITVLLPRSIEGEAAATPTGHPPAHAPVPPTVLLVDDDDAVRLVTGEMLRDLGCHVIEAADGGTALTLLDAEDAPALLMFDYAMPGMNGLELANATRTRGITAPIVMITGYAEFADKLGRSFDALLRKPFTTAELQTVLRQLQLTPAGAGGARMTIEGGRPAA